MVKSIYEHEDPLLRQEKKDKSKYFLGNSSYYIPEDSFWSVSRKQRKGMFAFLCNTCSLHRCGDYLMIIFSFIFWISVVDIIFFLGELYICGMEVKFLNIVPKDLVKLTSLGAKSSELIRKGEIQRLFIPIFLHGSLLHVLSNVLVQIYFGMGFERHWGIIKMSIIYILGGIGGNLVSAYLYSQSISVGASGAIYAVLGGKVANAIYRWRLMDTETRRYNKYSIALLLAISLLLSFTLNVDVGAHVGGFFMGLLLGFTLFTNHLSSRLLIKMCISSVVLVGVLVYVVAFSLLLFLDVASPVNDLSS